MFETKWDSILLSVESLQAAKEGVKIKCPDPSLGVPSSDLFTLELPKFQRGLVWTEKHGEEFQIALRDGWPLGGLVFAERDADELPGGGGFLRKYQLIDGQQRSYWLNRSRENFFRSSLYSLETPDAKVSFSRIALQVQTSDVEKLKDAYRAWTGKDDFEPKKSLHEYSLFYHELTSVTGIFPVPGGSEEEIQLRDAIVELNRDINSQYDSLVKLRIPVLVIRRELQEFLPDIFQRLNSSTSLSDLDLLAADWALVPAPLKKSKHLSDQEITALVSLAQGRIVDSYDRDAFDYSPDATDFDPDDLSLFDMLYALGKYACQKWPNTFQDLDKKSDRLAIFVAALLFGGGIGKRKEIRMRYPDETKEPFRDVSNFPSFFLQACKEIDSAFSDLNSVQAGRKLKGNLGLIQASVYIANYLNLVYKVGAGAHSTLQIFPRNRNDELRRNSDLEKLSVQKRKEIFSRNLIGWFLRDVLSEDFQGSDAYSNASARVWQDFDAESNRFIESEVMLQAVGKDDLGRNLQGRFVKELEIQITPKSRRYSEAGCAILRVGLAKSRHGVTNEEVDHVIPYDSRNEANFPIPINHFCNLMTSPKSLNSGRRDGFVQDYLPRLSGEESDLLLERLLIDPASATKQVIESKETYSTYLVDRWKLLLKMVLTGVNHPELKSTEEVEDFIQAHVTS